MADAIPTALARQIVGNLVRTMLEEKAKDILLRKYEDWWYGWQGDRWFGEDKLNQARYRITLAEARYNRLLEADPTPELVPGSIAALADLPALTTPNPELIAAQQAITRAQQWYDRVTKRVTEAMDRRRQQRIERLVTSLFTRYFRKARTQLWPVYHPAVPADLRNWVLRWKEREDLGPASLVLLWLVIEEAIDHHTTHQLDGLYGSDYLAKVSLVTRHIETDACEDEPTRAERDYVRWLQRRPPEPAHENLDPRDSRADLVYDGPSRDGDEDRCPHCQQFRRERTLEIKGRFGHGVSCERYCEYSLLSPLFKTKEQLREHQIVSTILGQPVAA